MSNSKHFRALVLAVACFPPLLHGQARQLPKALVDEIAPLLPAAPAGLGQPCADRVSWTPVSDRLADKVHAAEAALKSPIPAWNDEDYLDFSRTGNGPRGEAMLRGRDGELSMLVLAECSEWNGRFLDRIGEQLDVISAQRSWTLPAHDGKLENYSGHRYFVDLNAASLGYIVAETLYLLGDKLPANVRLRAMAALDQRIFTPTRRLVEHKDHEFWLDAPSNWNAVCWNGVTSAALTVLPDREQRAYFAAAGRFYSSAYLRSYSADGFAEEGIGYWSYGFGAYEHLREQLWSSTRGKIDLYDQEQARKAALFPFQFEMLPGVYADFADAQFMTKPDPSLMARIDRIFRLHLMDSAPQQVASNLSEVILQTFPIPSERQASSSGYAALIGDHTFYQDSGVLVSRPVPGGHLGVTIKAGGNGGHSHNDIGSYSIGLGTVQPVGTPGGPLFYTATTFTSTRFTSKLLNSFGHPVPEVDGQLQLEATKVKAPIVSTSFTPEKDTLTIDMTSAYSVPSLKSLTRTLVYSRVGGGSVDVTDDFQSSKPIDIEESFPTHGTVRQIDPKTLEFDLEKSNLRVTISSPAPFTLTQQTVSDYGVTFTRAGAKMHFDSSAKITMHFSEAP